MHVILAISSTAEVSHLNRGVCEWYSDIFYYRIMKICYMLPSYAVPSYTAVCFPDSYVYVSGWTEVWQAVALYAFSHASN